jgi:hypothetical protein
MNNKLKIILTVLLVLSFSSYAKSPSGIYMTISDYKNNRLTCESECVDQPQHKNIHIHDFFWNMPNIRVKCDGKKLTYKKSQLYGFRDCKNNVYRFYDNTEYRIAEAGNIYIYVQEKNIAQSKGYKVVNAYFFSTTADSEIIPLTLSNLKKAYKNNDKFHDLLDQYFNAGGVCVYDTQHNTFKINYVYSKTINR